jgi:hypothetical protein
MALFRLQVPPRTPKTRTPPESSEPNAADARPMRLFRHPDRNAAYFMRAVPPGSRAHSPLREAPTPAAAHTPAAPLPARKPAHRPAPCCAVSARRLGHSASSPDAAQRNPGPCATNTPGFQPSASIRATQSPQRLAWRGGLSLRSEPTLQTRAGRVNDRHTQQTPPPYASGTSLSKPARAGCAVCHAAALPRRDPAPGFCPPASSRRTQQHPLSPRIRSTTQHTRPTQPCIPPLSSSQRPPRCGCARFRITTLRFPTARS